MNTLFKIISLSPMTNLFFNSSPLFGRTEFNISLNLLNASNKYINYFKSNVLFYTRGNIAFSDLNDVLILCCYCRLNPYEVQINSTTQSLISQIGAPKWFIHLLYLLPSGNLEIKGIFMLKFVSFNVSSEDALALASSLQSKLLRIRSWMLLNGDAPIPFQIHSQPSKKTDVTIFRDIYKKFNHTGSVRTIRFYFPSVSGYTHSLSWLFSILFLPTPISDSFSDRVNIISDVTRFLNTNFYADISLALYNDLVNNILHWYFDGNTVISSNLTYNPKQPRSPFSGQSSPPSDFRSTSGPKDPPIKEEISFKKEKPKNRNTPLTPSGTRPISDEAVMRLFKAMIREVISETSNIPNTIFV